MSVLKSFQIAHESDAEEAFKWFKSSFFHNIPPYFLTHWKTNKKFFYAKESLLSYEETAQHLIVAGEPLVAAGHTNQEIYQSFYELAKRKNKTICGYYVSQSWNWSQFFKVPLGTSVRIPLQDFDLEAPEAKEVRRVLRKGYKLNYRALPIYRKERVHNKKVSRLFKKWKKKKLPFHMQFLLSKPQGKSLVEEYEEWFVVEKDGEPLAFCSLLPYLREGELGFYTDHLICDPKQNPQALSYLISFLIEILKAEGVSELNLGLNPFANVGSSNLMGKIFSLLYKIPFFYRPKGLHFFKRKFAGIEEREYCFFQRKKSKWFGLADMAKVTLISNNGPQ